jgi:hypothetical protein
MTGWRVNPEAGHTGYGTLHIARTAAACMHTPPHPYVDELKHPTGVAARCNRALQVKPWSDSPAAINHRACDNTPHDRHSGMGDGRSCACGKKFRRCSHGERVPPVVTTRRPRAILPSGPTCTSRRYTALRPRQSHPCGARASAGVAVTLPEDPARPLAGAGWNEAHRHSGLRLQGGKSISTYSASTRLKIFAPVQTIAAGRSTAGVDGIHEQPAAGAARAPRGGSAIFPPNAATGQAIPLNQQQPGTVPAPDHVPGASSCPQPVRN